MRFILSFCLMAGIAMACQPQTYSQEALEKAQQAGHTVVLHFDKKGCSTCLAQRAVLDELSGAEICQKITVLSVDVETQKEVARHYKVPFQGIFVELKNALETKRLVGYTDQSSIYNFLKANAQP